MKTNPGENSRIAESFSRLRACSRINSRRRGLMILALPVNRGRDDFAPRRGFDWPRSFADGIIGSFNLRVNVPLMNYSDGEKLRGSEILTVPDVQII